MNLKDYYSSLPDASFPKKDLLNEVVKRTGVSISTVRNWIFYGMRPSKPEHIAALVEVTGIKEEDLWKD